MRRGGSGAADGRAARARAARLRVVLTGVVLCALLAVDAPAAASPMPSRRSNLLLITADDLNADSAGYMGSRVAATPRLDALAASAHRFVGAHVTASICQPSRAALLTGRVPHRNGALGFEPIAADVPTLVEVLRAQGYFVAAINKLGHMQPRWKFPWDLALDGSGKRPRALRADVERCLDVARRERRQFFLDVNIHDPHRPFARRRGGELAADAVPVPGILEDVPAVRREIVRYYASVARFDESLGQVLDALDAAGHAGDTVLVFLSDHGMSFPFAKATVYRNGTWSPVLLRYPRMPPPATHEELVSSVDLMPTVLELLNIAPPAGMDGRSWVPLLRGEAQDGRDFVVTHVNTVRSGASFPQRCVRTRTRSLLFQPWADGHTRLRVEAMRGLTFPALAEAARHDPRIAARVRQLLFGVRLAFYDLERDPDERDNLIDVPGRRAEIERLQALLVAHMERTVDPQLEPFRQAIAAWRAPMALAARDAL
jgi:N-sulfoglucosamine sulfohydrolase